MNSPKNEDEKDPAQGKAPSDANDTSNLDQTIDEADLGQTMAEQTLSESEFISASGSSSGAASPANEQSDEAVPKIEGYRVIEPLGQGGMGTVWRAIQLSTSREVALKLLGGASFMSEQARPRFEREIRLAARLEHSNIATIYDSGNERGVYYYAMQLVQGEPLDEFILKRSLKRKYILKLIQIVCSAVQHAHEQGIVHRDLKPSNIMVTASGKPIVLDFGLAKMLGDEDEGEMTLTGVGDIAGTPAYMAPEQAEGRIEAIGPQTDVYALGAILYRMLTGDSPTDLSGSKLQVLNRIATGEVRSPRSIKPTIDGELEALIVKALEVKSEDRFQTAGEMASAITGYLKRLKAGLITQPDDDAPGGEVDDSGVSVHYSGLQTQQIKGSGSPLDELASATSDTGADLDLSAYQMTRSKKKNQQPIGLYLGGAAAVLGLMGVLIYAFSDGPEQADTDAPAELAEQTNEPSPWATPPRPQIPKPTPNEPAPTGPVIPPEITPEPVAIPPAPDPRPTIDPGPEPAAPQPHVIDNNVTARQAAEWILANGGELTTEGENLVPNSRLNWIKDRNALPADLATIDGVRLLPTSPEVFRHIPKLKALPGFKALIIECGRSDMQDDAIPELAELTMLRYFRISGEKIDNAFMEHLAKAKDLQFLKMNYIEIDTDHFQHIREMTELTNLTIRFTRLTNEHFSHMQWLRKLTQVEIYECTGFDYRAVRYLSDLPVLRRLSLVGARLEDAGIKPIQSMKQLEHLNIDKTGVSPKGLVQLQLALPDCKIMVRDGEVFKLPPEHLNRPDRNRPDREPPNRDRLPRRDDGGAGR